VHIHITDILSSLCHSGYKVSNFEGIIQISQHVPAIVNAWQRPAKKSKS